jgi:RimJ/RimL family protein N-acetyltransferase
VISIRPATPEDWPALREIRLTALRSAPDAYSSTFHRESGFDDTVWRERATGVPGRQTFLAVEESGRLVATATGLADPEEPADVRLLVGMWIDPAHRGQGLVDRLTAEVADWARRDGGRTLRLDVSVGNEVARAAYLRNGFRPTGERAPMPGRPDVLEEAMTLSLDETVSGTAE